MSDDDPAERAERQLEDMQARSERLGDRIERVRDDWERKKQDPQVPTSGDPAAASSDDDPPPELNYTTKGD